MFTVDNTFVEQLQAYLDYRAPRDKAQAQSRKKQKVVPLVLAARRILVSAKVQEGLKLVHEVQPGRLSLVDGYSLRRAANGTVDIVQEASSVGRSLHNDLMACELLKLGDKGTQLLTWQVIHRLWSLYLVKPLEALKDGPQSTLAVRNPRVVPLDQLEALKYRMMDHFAGNFWGESKKGSLLGAAIWRTVLDVEVASLTLKLFGPKATLRQYNRVVPHVAVLHQISQETPHLMRLLGTMLDSHQIPELEKDRSIPRNVVQLLRDHYLAHSFTPAAWAFLTHQGSSVSPFLVGLGSKLVNRLAELQCGQLPNGRWLKTLTNRYYMVNVDEFSKLLVLFSKAYAQRKAKAKDLTDNLMLLLDYFYQAKPKIGSQTTFQGFLKKQAEWHRKMAHEENQRQLTNLKEHYTWQPLVQTVELGELKATGLNSSGELIEEGVAMAHCVGGYFHSCYQNRCRIFSLTLAGQRVATLEVTCRGERWSQGQLYGPGNSKITDKKVIQLARRVVAACNKAPALDVRLNTVEKLLSADAAKPMARQQRLLRGLDAREENPTEELLAA